MATQKRGGRAPEVVERLERSRDRLRQRRARERQRENEIKAAVAQHIDAWQSTNALIAGRDTEIEKLRTQIAELETACAHQVALQRARQATAAAAIKQYGESDEAIAELLEITTREVRQLLTAARTSTGGEHSERQQKPVDIWERRESVPHEDSGEGRKGQPEATEADGANRTDRM
ncbi:hypothetical protein [Nocardia testacea]|uniref:hypothetical protein n=1 Tax=Nocardia testacea TaxID=248551 RepID=UPI003A84AEF4